MPTTGTFVRYSSEADPNKVFQVMGDQLVPIYDERDLMERTGTKTVADAWKVANVKVFPTFKGSPYEGKSIPQQFIKTANANTGGDTTGNTTGDSTGKTTDDKTTPDWLKNNDNFNALDDDDKQYVIDYYNVLKINDEESQKVLKQALEDAKAQADPYFAEKIRIAQDELKTALGEQATDFESKKKDLDSKIKQIDEDLTLGRDRLSVDEQAELSRQKSKYEMARETLIESAASTGLTFSSKRAVAESRLDTENQDIVESTKRTFQRKLDDLSTQASRGNLEAKKALEDYQRIYGENVGKLTSATEQVIGTKNLPSGISGVLGDVTGSLESEKLNDITTRATALVNLRNPFF